MNIKIDSDKVKFKLRVGGLIIIDNKILTVQIMDNGFYCLPGGHILLGENSITAIKREIKEEANLEVDVIGLKSIIENTFYRANGDMVHEIQLIYGLKITDEKYSNENWTVVEKDDDCDKKLEFKWIPISELDNFQVKPIILKDLLQANCFQHYVIDNEHLVTK